MLTLTINLFFFQEMALSKKTDVRQMWEKIPFALNFKVYLFNYTNAEEVQKGAIPIVKEVGPYHFEWVSNSLTFGDYIFSSYYQPISWHFNILRDKLPHTDFIRETCHKRSWVLIKKFKIKRTVASARPIVVL